MVEPFSIIDAVAAGIERIRMPNWPNPMDHLKIDITADGLGPWMHLYCPSNAVINRCDPVDFLWVVETDGDITKPIWVEYTGPLPDSEAYQQDAAKWINAEVRA